MVTENCVWGQKKRLFVSGGFVCLAMFGAGAWLTGCSTIPVAHDATLEKQIRRDFAEAASLRGLPKKREVAIERESLDGLQKSLSKELDKEENRVYLADTELFLKQFRVLKPGDDLKKIFLKLMTQQVMAYYDPSEKRVAYVEGAGGSSATNLAQMPGMQRFVYVHEFCHAIEDGHFDLERLDTESQVSFDRNMALTSLIEGDAVLVGMDSLFAEYPVNTATPLGASLVKLLPHVDLNKAKDGLEDCPPFLGSALIRPYLDGTAFANRIRRESGWRGIDEVYRTHLPQTTAEILYPEKRFLSGFKPAVFEPRGALFAPATRGVCTNSLGALGTALWLGGDKMVNPGAYPFLEGWLGDCVYLLKGERGSVATVWLTYMERPGQARALKRELERRLGKGGGFDHAPWRVVRDGRLVAAVWSSPGDKPEICEELAACALRTRVKAKTPSLARSWCEDFPWPLRVHAFDGYSSGYDVLGGYAVDMRDGASFMRFNLASGLILRAEENPDRHYLGTLGGLVRHVGDERSDFTYWKIPLVASWFRRGHGDDCQYRWRVLWGLLASGKENEVRMLLVPVWRAHAPAAPAAPK